MVVNGWTLYTHPLFKEQYLSLKTQVEALRTKDPKGYVKKNATKRLAAIHRLIFELIPHDPTSSEFRQGSTLGDNNKHWFRAKFFQQYRLFFRYHLESKVIVYVWVNDDKNKRVYGSKTDVYKVFEKMLTSGNPPEEWDDLLKVAKNEMLSP
jgi:toxin YhaV